jgi:predicted phage terminase large subunit-like protein
VERIFTNQYEKNMSVKLVLANKSNKQALIEWEEFRLSITHSTPVDLNETIAEKKKRIARLEADKEEWFKYYFPKYAYSEPAQFHKRATRRIIDHAEWYEVRMWSRELAKSTRTMMEVLYLCLTKKKRYVLMISNSFDNACRLIMPYKANLEFNQRIINDYGVQEKPGKWMAEEFFTRAGVAFRALGAGQSPRGTRNEEVRPDVLLFDDIDTDEECRNPEMITKKWKWIEEAAIGTRSISNPTLIIFCGNRIAADCCVVRACEFADHVDEINIRDKNGKSTWPQKNTEQHIDRVLGQKSYSATQKEYFNTPIVEGTVFKNLSFKALPRLREYPFLVCYTDPSFRSSNKSDYKATVLVGPHQGQRHVLKAYCQQTTTGNMIEWLYAIDKMIDGTVPVYYFIEKNTNDEEIKRQLAEIAKEKYKGKTIPVNFDERAKGDKFSRIEATLEPLDRNGRLYFNETEQEDPGMKNLIAQFKAFAPKSRAHDDGPDAIEGAVFILNNKEDVQAAGAVTTIKRKPNAKRY